MNARALLDGEIAELVEGAEFTTRARTITEGDLTSFSALTGDWHPQHSDAEWAAQSQFARRVAHGMLVLSYAVGLMPFDPERVIALRGIDSATFKRPVAIGDTIRVRCRVASTRRLDAETALVTLALRITNQDRQLVALARLEALCRQKPGPVGERASSADSGGQEWTGPRSGTGPESLADELMRLYGGELFL